MPRSHTTLLNPIPATFNGTSYLFSGGPIGIGGTAVNILDIFTTGNNQQDIAIQNSTAGTAASSGIRFATDESVVATGRIGSTGTLYNTAVASAWDPINMANAFNIVGARAGGTNVVASNGTLRFYANGQLDSNRIANLTTTGAVFTVTAGFGVVTASAGATNKDANGISGFIWIVDKTGNSRKLAVLT